MASAFQQQIFALDARFNAYRAPGNPNFKTLYIRRRSQLLRENAKFKDIETIKKYIHIRSQLLQRRYGVQDNISISSSSSRARSSSKASLAVEDCITINAKKKNDMTISENYAFTGVHHIFDQHTDQVSMVKFANNDRSKLCCASHDGTVSICDVTATPPRVAFVLDGHTQPVTGCDWSASNELLVTCGGDGMLVLWDVPRRRQLRAVPDQLHAPLMCCVFQPANNNMVIAGNARGMVEVLNISTGIYPRGGSSILGGRVLSIACESSGRMFWAANDKGVIVSYRMSGAGGSLSKLRRCSVGGAVTCLSWSPWLARHPALLVSAATDSLYLFRITDREGSLSLKKRYETSHRSHSVKSSFCPIMSFRRGVCVVTGSEDACVYFLDIEGHDDHPVVNKLQGHAHPVLGVSFSYDESLLATSDASGLVIIWRRG
ncbi:WD repeat-containing protein 13-like isoform X6 [Leptidea sinapis]|uniref:WD repeat-containing protein 13-like isoform X1 n=1 Tax=Leptidea sinapis TaxID=189913 RepID=UPI00213F672F|nr:WD repeat-containing protein 13-like isoform X1 [Leptidea sinapis]XP_050670900.1 WD repeat-containing protein 13-like isoform X2 [Leptidea sinapis]XP_050670901.1 WD repeat-containing protein 13-like isoform X3 [Leptidea sinapis]XP_050670902.1 WD repeat-containing protein 13-like isoform X4 [Leptidea sinapis]XP_050670903.1 WD repeat-containing protein 13-like isoform X5 [Leptidea sinapis]XP_050670904.1 WD repeat-containing protein 13-like isoform X6 [Leptidea sinapis]